MEHCELLSAVSICIMYCTSHPSSVDTNCVQANLRTKLTSSMQTNLSNMRRDNATQVYPPKYVLCLINLKTVVS